MSACVVQAADVLGSQQRGRVWIGKRVGWAGLDGDEAWGGNVTPGMKDKWVGHRLKEWKSTVSVPGTFLGKTNNRQVLQLPLFEWGTFCNMGFNAEIWCGLWAFWGLMAQNKKPLIFIKPNIYLFLLPSQTTYHRNFACEENNDFLNYSLVKHVGECDLKLFY